MNAPACKVVRNGEIQVTASEDLVPGDVIVLEAGDAVPAGGRILECASLKVEESALSGESFRWKSKQRLCRKTIHRWVIAEIWSIYGKQCGIWQRTCSDHCNRYAYRNGKDCRCDSGKQRGSNTLCSRS